MGSPVVAEPVNPPTLLTPVVNQAPVVSPLSLMVSPLSLAGMNPMSPVVAGGWGW